MLFARAAQLRNDRECPELHERVAEQIKEHGRISRCCFRRSTSRHGGNGRKSHQNITGVRNGAVGQQPLDVRLHQRAQIAGEHRKRRERPEGPEPEVRGGRNRRKDAQQQSERRGLRSRGKKRRNRRWSALVDVRRPHLERRGGHLEAQADQDHGQPKLEKRAMKKLLGAHFGQHRRSARSIHQRDPVEEKRRRERAQQEILHRRFGRLERIAAVSRQNVAGDRTHLQADERGEQLLRRSKHAHARRGKQQQRVKFREGKPFPLQVWPCC